MQPYICGKFIDKYLIASRSSSVGATINEETYKKFVYLSKNDSEIPAWIINLLTKLGAKTDSKQKLNELFLVKEEKNYNYGKASYEITETCNYNCIHCYLGRKTKSGLLLSDKKQIIKTIENSGCLWLQITGGEPLIDRDFVKIYLYAYRLGLLITLSTNGSLLTEHHIAETLKQYPPYRLTISMYGATSSSYELLTRTPGSFNKFIAGMNWAKKSKVRTRVNIIITRYNQTEKNDMVGLAKKFGFENYTFSTIIPTLQGDNVPIKLMAADCEYTEKTKEDRSKINDYTQCTAGCNSFHVNSRGEMSICKAAREPYVEIIRREMIDFSKLVKFSKQLFDSPALCSACELRKSCNTCPLILKLYLSGKTVPLSVCRKYYTKGGE
jgi:MoaA/NifB/PqqE/SkfB family radical SAM enzyme